MCAIDERCQIASLAGTRERGIEAVQGALLLLLPHIESGGIHKGTAFWRATERRGRPYSGCVAARKCVNRPILRGTARSWRVPKCRRLDPVRLDVVRHTKRAYTPLVFLVHYAS